MELVLFFLCGSLQVVEVGGLGVGWGFGEESGNGGGCSIGGTW